MNDQAGLQDVIDSGFCIGCGACVAAEDGLTLHLHPEKLMYEPDSDGGAVAASVCPAVRVNYPGLQQKLFGELAASPVGVVTAMALAQSTDRERNLASSSGGIVKELLREYLSRDEVDGVIALSHAGGTLFRPSLITDPDQVDRLPGSIYHNVPFDGALELLKASQGRFVLVANPCQLEGIYAYIFECAPYLASRIHASIGLVCGWTYGHHALKALCQYKGLDFGDLRDVAYRGEGAVGRARLRTSGVDMAISRRRDFDYIAAFDRSFNIRRCHLCINHINFLADIVVGDAWLRRTAKTRTGVSIVICRTPEAAELVGRLAREGKIRTAPADESDIVESQGRDLTYGDFAYAYADYLRRKGEYCPDLAGPNRPAARPVSDRRVGRFHRETRRKMRLQRLGRYRTLWWRKIAVDLMKYGCRFAVKVLSRGLRALRRSRSTSDESAIRDFS